MKTLFCGWPVMAHETHTRRSEVPFLRTCNFRFWGQMTAIVSKMSFKIIDWTPNYVSWLNLVKIGCCDIAERSSGLPHKKTLAPWNPHFARNGPIVPKIPWMLSPVDLSTFTEFGPDQLHFARLIVERFIFRTPEVNTI